ncbi:UNKNOWN [Stylonychia lemnae]|uniref:Uncharacterized protein n=1 Tax=Stylonychia lemnae TaxID=5949 RepID=A0A078B707_STYLE|nr:UNKNOWN [Stylonychia lemnae]|eukprot:CDW89976.1 UNKNOWN [Stylonychia lemnae]
MFNRQDKPKVIIPKKKKKKTTLDIELTAEGEIKISQNQETVFEKQSIEEQLRKSMQNSQFAGKLTEEEVEQQKNIENAIKLRQEKAKATDFYYLLEQVNDRIHMYKSIFFDKKPRYLIDYQEELKKKKIITVNDSLEGSIDRKTIDDERKLRNEHRKNKQDAIYESLSTPRLKQKQRKQTLKKTGSNYDSAIQIQTMKLPTMQHTLLGGDLLYNMRSTLPRVKESSTSTVVDDQLDNMILNRQSTFGEEPDSKGNKKGNKQGGMDILNDSQILVHKNDISYLSKMRSGSLPYLKKFQPEAPSIQVLQPYLQQRIKEIQEKSQIIPDDAKYERKRLKLLKLGEKKFKKLNQKSILNKSSSANAFMQIPASKTTNTSFRKESDPSPNKEEKVYKKNGETLLPSIKQSVNMTDRDKALHILNKIKRKQRLSLGDFKDIKKPDFGSFQSLLSKYKPDEKKTLMFLKTPRIQPANNNADLQL